MRTGKEVYLAERFKRVNQGNDGNEYQRRGKITDLDVPENLPLVVGVQIGRFHGILGDVAQRSEEKNHVVA